MNKHSKLLKKLAVSAIVLLGLGSGISIANNPAQAQDNYNNQTREEQARDYIYRIGKHGSYSFDPDKRTYTYVIQHPNTRSGKLIARHMRYAVKKWNKQISPYRFVRVSNHHLKSACIVISYKNMHGRYNGLEQTTSFYGRLWIQKQCHIWIDPYVWDNHGNNLTTTCGHELGHTLGLDDQRRNRHNIMYYETTNNQFHISRDDIRFIYNLRYNAGLYRTWFQNTFHSKD